MKPVVQRDRTGCAIASVATLAGLRYGHVKRVADQFGISVTDPCLWSDTHPMRTLLKHYRLPAASGETPFVSWQDLPDVALLAIKWHREKGRAFWHWVVFWRSPQGPVVLDSKRSLRRHVRTDFGRMKPKWWIGVGPLRHR